MGDAAQAVRDAAMALKPVSDSPRFEAELLLAHCLDMPRGNMLLQLHMLDAPAGYADLLERRLTGEPLAYITGVTEFRGLSIRVTPDVLIPRSDSETLMTVAEREWPADAPLRLLDLGTGSGALLLAALDLFPSATGLGTDSSAAALAVARDNAERLRLADRAVFRQIDWTRAGWIEACEGPFDAILANPPYVEADAVLDPQVRDFEPHAALFAGADGLDAYRLLLPALDRLLMRGGLALFEIGWQQRVAVTALAQAAGYDCRAYRDLGGRDRVITVRK